MKRLFGLIGYPVEQSFSRLYFQKKFATSGIDAEYRLFPMPDLGELRPLIEAHPELCGLNVTIPHKQQVIPLLDELDPTAQAIGAVNVIRIIRQADGYLLRGYNTDSIGFSSSIRPYLKPYMTHALILGTGGASRAVRYGLEQAGISVQFVSRLPKAGALCYEDLNADIIRRHLLIVNATPLGMFPNTDQCANLPYDLLTPQHLLYDVVYNPETTRFMQLGRDHGAQTIGGTGMLTGQAEAAWEIWNGQVSS
ncbi:MAG: shikimate dehydrogenase [Paludibacteraceae bacterium]|nr:shikimate dehydrogenase [Paludibacteraceae bacterium]